MSRLRSFSLALVGVFIPGAACCLTGRWGWGLIQSAAILTLLSVSLALGIVFHLLSLAALLADEGGGVGARRDRGSTFEG